MSLFEELKRRNVFRVGVAYVVGAWLLLQLTEVLSELLNLPEEFGPIVVAVVTIGFPVVLFFAWAYEMTPQGLKREKDIDRSQSVNQESGRRLDRAIIGLLAVALAYFVYESRFMDREPAAQTTAEVGIQSTGAEELADTAVETANQESMNVDKNAIAVLPFANRSLKEEDLFFTDGIHDDLLTQLAKITGLKVISRTSVMEYRDTTKKIPEIATELGVGKILEGGVQRAGDRVRINAQLIDVTTDQHLWAETFDREMTIDNIFDIQSEITRQIVTAVKGELSAADQQSLGGRPTDSLAAWEAWLHAENIIAETDYSADKYQRAEPFAREAVEEDASFADAWITLAGIQMQSIWIGYENTEEQRERVRQNLARAEAIAPTSANVKAARADYHYRIDLDYARSLELLEEARALAPGEAEIYRDLGLTLRRLGRWDESVAAFEKTLDLDPLNSFAASTLAETLSIMNDWERLEPLVDLWLTRDPDSSDLVSWKVVALINRYGDLDAAEQLLQAYEGRSDERFSIARSLVAVLRRDWDGLIQINHERGNFALLPVMDMTPPYRLGWSHAQKGDLETARAYFEQYLAEARQNEPSGRRARAFRAMNQAEAQAWLGNIDAALALADLSTSLLSREDDHVFGAGLNHRDIWLLAFTGQRDQALDRIAELLDQPEGPTRWQLYLGPSWDFFRDDPRFNELVRPEGIEPDPFMERPDRGAP
jgi:TolB-like protein/Tfp pilus assembly protein PilF